MEACDDGDGDGVRGGGARGARDPHTPEGSYATEGVRRRVGGVMFTDWDRNGGGDGDGDVRTPMTTTTTTTTTTMTMMSDEMPPVSDDDSKAMENLRRWTVETWRMRRW